MEPVRSEEVVAERTGLVSRAVQLPEPLVPDPRIVLAAVGTPRTFWAAPGEATVVGGGAAATLQADGPERFDAIRESAEELFAVGDVHAGALAARPRLFGGFAFHDDHEASEPWTGYPGARFVLPAVQVTYTDDGIWLSVNAVDATVADVERRLAAHREWLVDLEPTPLDGPPGVVDRERTTAPATWRRGVAEAVERIRAGELRKVVLAQALEARLERPLAMPDALDRLGEAYPDCIRFLHEPGRLAVEGEADRDSGRADDRGDDEVDDEVDDRGDDEVDGRDDEGVDDRDDDEVDIHDGDLDDGRGRGGAFFGATPERLVAVRGRTVETGALAGTTGRGDTPAEDDWLATELLEDPKNVHEHELVTDAIREQLEPYAASIRTGDRGIRRLATVQHIETPIAAELATDEHVLTLVEALHPTPAVGGLPPGEALRTIRETEPFERGWYAAPIGWFDAAGHGSFAVALRSAVTGRTDGDWTDTTVEGYDDAIGQRDAEETGDRDHIGDDHVQTTQGNAVTIGGDGSTTDGDGARRDSDGDGDDARRYDDGDDSRRDGDDGDGARRNGDDARRDDEDSPMIAGDGDIVTLFAGVGVVADSDPDREWDEVQLKYRPVLDVLE